MCFSFESSFHSWLYSLFLCFILLFYNNSIQNLWIVFFVITFTQIQIIESLIWLSKDYDNEKSVLGKYIPFLLWLQPFIQTIGAYMVTKNNYLLILSGIYLYLALQSLNTTDTYKIKISKSNHLIWKRYSNDGKEYKSIFGENENYQYLYIFGLFFGLLFIPNEIMKYALILFGIISILYINNKYTSEEFSSQWCNISINYILSANIINFIFI